MEEGKHTKLDPCHTVLHYYRKFMKTETQNGKKTKSVSGQQINKDGE